jgi:hypothetical protein
MKKTQVTDQAYQNATLGSEGALPSSGANDASDSSEKEVNSEETSHHIIDRNIRAVRGTQKKPYSKPTLINYGTARELAKRFGSRLKWPDLFK